MNPISLTRSVVLGNIVIALTTALRGRRNTRTPNTGPFESPLTSVRALDTSGDYAGLLGSSTFLVVDDNPIDQRIAARILEFAGATVTVAGSGEQAVLLLERERYDMIIMDLLMPIMDGYAATRYIRNHLRLDTPVLALSADPTPGRRTRCLQAGMNDYMLKPFELSDLFERITNLLNLSGSHYLHPMP